LKPGRPEPGNAGLGRVSWIRLAPCHRGMQDRHLHTFGCMDNTPERETERPRHVLDSLPGRHQFRRTQGELLTAQPQAAGASGFDIPVPIRLAPEVQPDHDCVPCAEGAYRGMAHDAGLAAYVFEVRECGMTCEVQGRPVHHTAGIFRQRSRESHRPPAFLSLVTPMEERAISPASRAASLAGRGGGSFSTGPKARLVRLAAVAATAARVPPGPSSARTAGGTGTRASRVHAGKCISHPASASSSWRWPPSERS
jgi:hypothetical protein